MERLKSVLLLVNIALISAEWSYSGENGPNFWGMSYPACSQGKQSPINIEHGAAMTDNRLPSFRFDGYDNTETLENLTVWNDGYTVTVRVHGNLGIEDGGLTGKYSLEHFHFHWGSNDGVGSEHVLDGTSYPLEMHLVHKARRHKKISKALADPTGLAVLGVFAKIGKHHPHLQTIINGLESLDIGDWSNIKPFAIKNLFPEDTETFYRYQGSLTTPPCSESVVWTVFKEPIEMSETQMERIRGLAMISNITDNYRPVQNLNGRGLYIRKRDGGDTNTNNALAGLDGGSIANMPSASVLLCALFYLFVR